MSNPIVYTEMTRTIPTNNPHVDFRDGQWEAITALVNQKQRPLTVQGTGWGKSMVRTCRTRWPSQIGEEKIHRCLITHHA